MVYRIINHKSQIIPYDDADGESRIIMPKGQIVLDRLSPSLRALNKSGYITIMSKVPGVKAKVDGTKDIIVESDSPKSESSKPRRTRKKRPVAKTPNKEE